jgi:hypothetical protein
LSHFCDIKGYCSSVNVNPIYLFYYGRVFHSFVLNLRYTFFFLQSITPLQYSVKILNFLKICLQDSRLCSPVITRIIFFCSRNTCIVSPHCPNIKFDSIIVTGKMQSKYSIEQNSIWVRALPCPMHLGLKTGPLCRMFCTKLKEP